MTADRDRLELIEKYRLAFLEAGLDLDPVHEMTAEELPTGLPLAVSAYYEFAGHHPVNIAHNRLVPIGDLRTGPAGRLVFMVESQEVAQWSVDVDTGHDPPVFQGVSNPDGTVDWFAEDLAFSDFIIAMNRWTTTGDEPLR